MSAIKWVSNLLVASSILALAAGPVRAQVTIPGVPLVPVGNCQLSATQLGSSIGLASCTRASFTVSAGSPSTRLVVTAVTGIILVGDTVLTGTGITAGTTIVSQLSGTVGGAGTYIGSVANTTSSASATSGGIPASATMAYLQAETASVRYRDDGAAPTTAIGNLVVNGIPGILYSGNLGALRFIGASGSPLLDIAFYK